MRIGAWWNVGGRDTAAHLQAHLAAVQELKLDRVAIMVNDVEDKKEYRCRWSTKALTALVKGLQALKVEVALTSWVYPRQDYIEPLVVELPDLARRVGVKELEIEAEGNWKAKHLKGYLSLEEAADYMMGHLHEAEGIASLGVTTYTSMVTRIPELVQWSDSVAVQAYSLASDHVWHGPYGPGALQRLAIARARQASRGAGLEGQGLRVGLPAPGWDQKWLAHDIEEAIALEREACEAEGVEDAMVWSWFHLVGKDGLDRGPCWGWFKGNGGKA